MASKTNRWTPLENKIYQWLKADGVMDGKALAAVSGGMDSILLVEILQRLSQPLRLKLAVAHIHHGGRSAYRLKAQKFVQQWCQQHSVPFMTMNSPKSLRSESEAREFRWEALRQMQVDWQARWIFLGHHQDDLLETRLIRLLRGTGPQGLRAMSRVRGERVRPFLEVPRGELEKEARERSLVWVEDPSNKSKAYLRNWLRHQWLPSLEKRIPGGHKALARSLELLLESHSGATNERKESMQISSSGGLLRSRFLRLSERQKKECLARYISSLEIKDFTQNHIREVLRQLDNPKNVHTFTVAKLVWTLTKDRIFALRRDNQEVMSRAENRE